MKDEFSRIIEKLSKESTEKVTKLFKETTKNINKINIKQDSSVYKRSVVDQVVGFFKQLLTNPDLNGGIKVDDYLIKEFESNLTNKRNLMIHQWRSS